MDISDYFNGTGVVSNATFLYVIFLIFDVFLTQVLRSGAVEGVGLGSRQLRQNHVNSTFYDMII